MRSFIIFYLSLVVLFFLSTAALYQLDRQNVPRVVGISFQGGSYCARFPLLGETQCHQFVELPLAQWPLRANGNGQYIYEQ